MPRRVIAHVDIDAFYASVELQRRPELEGLPVIVSHASPRAVVTTASYEARAFGVHSAMPTEHAKRLCPQAVIVTPDFTAYREASQAVWDLVRERIGDVEQLGLDEGYLDLSLLDKPKVAMRELVEHVRAHTGLTLSVGIGPNKLVAKVASDCEKPAGLVALSREMACERFAQSPPRLLPGIGPKTAARLDEMGITTLAILRATDPEALVARFGANTGPFLLRRANFEDEAPLQARRTVASQSSETTFDRDLDSLHDMESVVRRLAEQLGESLRKRDRHGRTIGLKVRLRDFTTVTRARTLPDPTDDGAVIAGVAVELLRAYAPPQPVRLLGVRVAGFVDPAAPGTAAERAAAEQLRLQV